MDPMNRGPQDFGHDEGRTGADGADGAFDAEHKEHAGSARQADTPQRPPRDAITPDFGSPVPARTVQLVSGDLLLTVNPVDGSEIEACPPGELPPCPRKLTPAERTELARAAVPPVPPGPEQPRSVLLERQDEREDLVRLLARGRSVRLTGARGSGRTALLATVAEDCLDLAPDGVIRLNGHKRGVGELLHDLYASVYKSPLHRPDRAEILGLVHDIGAVVVVDDLEFGGSALDELLDATPECAYLLAATPDIPEPGPEAHIEEVSLGGLARSAGLDLLERAVGRPLTEDETAWAGDLWFESEGLPLRFIQAGALLRQRDLLRADPAAFDESGHYEGPGAAPVHAPLDMPSDAPVDGTEDAGDSEDAPAEAEDGHIPLPSLAEGAAPAEMLASRLSESARTTLRFAVALGGEVPHQAHLPALVGDTHADAALGELAAVALVTPVGARWRLAAGVHTQLAAAGYAASAEERAELAHTAAQHYAWWAGHPSVTPERAAGEAEAALAALTVLLAAPESGHTSSAVLLARTAAPAYAAGLDWSVWERTLRAGQEAARVAGEVAEEAYFHHELGILALLGGHLDRARAELEASIGLRGALADKRGTVAGRRALALVADRSGEVLPGARTPAGEEAPDARYEEPASPPGGIPAALALPARDEEPPTLISRPGASGGASGGRLGGPGGGSGGTGDGGGEGRGPGGAWLKGGSAGRAVLSGTRRNLVAAGAGALLAAVLGTVVTLGATSDEDPSNRVRPDRTTSEQSVGDGLDADEPTAGEESAESTRRPSEPGEDGSAGASDEPTRPGASASPSDEPGEDPTTGKPTQTSESPDAGETTSESPDPGGTASESPDPGGTVSESPDPGGTVSESPSASPDNSTTASASASGSQTESESASRPVGSPVGSSESGPADSTSASESAFGVI
ncbi:ATP-binding protein [Streptomyces sp. KLOTTS4A1]|uniref:ATP-binding protein n=1 Tax=Streptomyces sp. KLOTTS4A1 TaxID=3390996 RepID=UPI0039F500DD